MIDLVQIAATSLLMAGSFSLGRAAQARAANREFERLRGIIRRERQALSDHIEMRGGDYRDLYREGTVQ